MSGVKRFEAHYLTEGVMGGKALACAEMVLASDYDACASKLHEVAEVCAIAEQERDELASQLGAMRALLTDARRYVDKAWPDGVHSYRANSVSGDLLSKIDAALQEPKP